VRHERVSFLLQDYLIINLKLMHFSAFGRDCNEGAKTWILGGYSERKFFLKASICTHSA